ncbi:MAG: hypothetical protein AB3N20_02470 [Rhizobiaceae bacterium]
MPMPRVDIKSEFGQVDFSARQMRIEAHNAGERVKTIQHVRELLVQLEDGRISTELAMNWLNRYERGRAQRS